MGISTLLKYLIGRREAVLQIAASRHAIWLGALFVLSAGLAREYDGHDLLHEPGHLALPFIASLITSFLLFGLVSQVARLRKIGEIPFLATYRSFLALYWMTAPLAWLYAIPVERFLSPLDAVKANLCLLGIVSVWRVALISRVVSVLFGCRYLAALVVVLLFADMVVVVTLAQFQLSLVVMMGGVRLSEPEELTEDVTGVVLAVGFFTFLVWLAATLAVAYWRGAPWRLAIDDSTATRRVYPSAWYLGLASVITWTAVLPSTQPEQQLRYEVERDLTAGRLVEAVDTTSAHDRTDFPPHWDPPPRTRLMTPNPVDIAVVAVDRNAAPWVRATYLEKLARYDARWEFRYENAGGRVDRFLDLALQIPEGPMLADAHRKTLEEVLQDDTPRERREKIERLLKMADQHRTEQP